MKLDQFYTKENIAESCFNIIKMKIGSDFDIFIEPSVGRGAFFYLFPINKRIGIDLEPKVIEMNSGDVIIKEDFLKFNINSINLPWNKLIIIGNPPFGVGCSMAVKFFNHAASFSNFICFIVPRTFKRISVQNQLNMNYHLIHTHDLPLDPCCFEPKMAAKCCFQIWEKKTIKREKIIYKTLHNDFVFLKLGEKDINGQPSVPIGSDFAIKAYGSNCGKIFIENTDKFRPKSYHWIKSNINKNILIDRLNSLDYSISKESARQDSLGQGELINLYELSFDKNQFS